MLYATGIPAISVSKTAPLLLDDNINSREPSRQFSVPRSESKTRLPNIIQLYYITHIDNVASILNHGILSHQEIENQRIPYVAIYNKEIVDRRQAKITPAGKSLWEYANLYFKARNAMLYKVSIEKPINQIVVVAVDFNSVVALSGTMISIGNAAHNLAEFIPTTPRKRIGEAFTKFRGTLALDYWREDDGTKRLMMSECLVVGNVPADRITGIYATDQSAAGNVRQILKRANRSRISVIPDPNMFFQPSFEKRLTTHLLLKGGDMFFSRLQTLTVSVNTVGVMGKGVASRAKYQFPDVYVEYQDALRRKGLAMGKPYLYKREKSVDFELADEPNTLQEPNAQTWFLLFATKKHYSERASKEGIEKGLKWIQANYKKEGITSLAVPALGAGLGRLEWKEIGPIICQHLASLDVDVEVYLPAEKEIPPKDQLTREFLIPEGVPRDSTL